MPGRDSPHRFTKIAPCSALGQRRASGPGGHCRQRDTLMILVTGGAGFIGSNVVASLNEAGHTDIAVNDQLGSDGKWRNLQKRQIADMIGPDDLFGWLE